MSITVVFSGSTQFTEAPEEGMTLSEVFEEVGVETPLPEGKRVFVNTHDATSNDYERYLVKDGDTVALVGHKALG
jgi:molybdopterin converting factor small subunit